MTEHHGHHRLARQQGHRGYFADVSLTVQVEPGPPGLTVLFDDAGGPWRAGASFGVAYAVERSRLDARHVTVQVTRLQGMIVDTTQILVAYASALAFWHALGVRPDRVPTLDLDTGIVSFPK